MERSVATVRGHEMVAALRENIQRMIVGKDDAINLAIIALLSKGHVLVEDVPGIGKTTLAKALAQSLGCSFSRIQFTPDLMPTDITGSTIYNPAGGEFQFNATLKKTGRTARKTQWLWLAEVAGSGVGPRVLGTTQFGAFTIPPDLTRRYPATLGIRLVGVDGLLLTDDIDMQALDGTIPERSVRALEAGCDLVLNCWAKLDDMAGIVEACGAISSESAARLDRALASVELPESPADPDALVAIRDTLFAAADVAL